MKLGMKAEAKQDYDAALNYYEQAVEEDSREPAYTIASQRMRIKCNDQHLTQGRQLQKAQKLNEALVQFRKALLADPSSQVALQEINTTNQMIKDKAKVPDGTPIYTPAERAREELERRVATLQGPPTLRPINNQISSLKMNNQTARVLYESVGKLAGINVLFDPQGIDILGSATKNYNLDLRDLTLEDALADVALTTHTFWKVINRNSIFVTQESEPKRQEYQDEVAKVFYIQNASTPNEFTEMFNAVRTGAHLNVGIFQVPSQNAIVVRGTPDTMSIIEKLLHDLDRPKAEVMVDLIVMEVSRSKITNLGASLGGVGGLSQGITYNPRNPVTITGTTATTSTTATTATTSTTATTGAGGTGASIALSQLGKVSTGDFATSLPGAMLVATLSDSTTRLLQHPQVRVTDGGKASLKIGQKIPYVSGSLNSAVATPGSIPYATTQFQQIEVGVLIDVEAHVNGADELSLHVKAEISNTLTPQTIAGVQEPVIAQDVNEANIRLKDGEVSLIGGLTKDSVTNGVSGIPGVTNMPVLGYLFGQRNNDREKDDIVIALIPHIIRTPNMGTPGDDGILAGTERVVRVERRAPASNTPPPTLPPSSGTPSGPPRSDLTLPPTQNPRVPAGPGNPSCPLRQ
jgi:general secretion pathway protein D